MNSTIALIESIFANPPKPFDPVNQTLKGWAVFCLRDRGFKVATFSLKADFVVESKTGDLSFKVMQAADASVSEAILSDQPSGITWIVVDASGTRAIVVEPRV